MLKGLALVAVVATSMSAGTVLAHGEDTKYVNLAFNQEYAFGQWDDWTDVFMDGGNYDTVGSSDWSRTVFHVDYHKFMESRWAKEPAKGFFE